MRKARFFTNFLSIFKEKFEISGKIGTLILVKSGQKTAPETPLPAPAPAPEKNPHTAPKTAPAPARAVKLYHIIIKKTLISN